MENKTISKEQIEMLFGATLSEFRLSQEYADHFGDSDDNTFRSQFAGMRRAIDILGLGSEYLAFMVKKEDSND